MEPNQPIGSQPATTPCEPCHDPSSDCQATTNELAIRLCAVEAQFREALRLNSILRGKQSEQGNTINQLLEEMTKLRALITEISGITVPSCSSLEGILSADGVKVCDAGTEKMFRPQTTPHEIVFCGTRAKLVPKGLRWFPLDAKVLVLNQANMASNNAAVVLPSYPTDACGSVWAQFESTGQAFPGPSASGTNVVVKMNGDLLLVTGFVGDFAGGQAMARVTSANSVFEVTTAGSGVRSCSVSLVGYFY